MYQISDEQGGAIAADMIRTMSQYLAGPGFAGFLAWIDQQWPAASCDCGHVHGVDAAAIRMNLERLSAAITEADHG